MRGDAIGPLHGLLLGLERETGFEPATPCLEGRHSTAELLPLVIQDTHAPMARQRRVRPNAVPNAVEVRHGQ